MSEMISIRDYAILPAFETDQLCNQAMNTRIHQPADLLCQNRSWGLTFSVLGLMKHEGAPQHPRRWLSSTRRMRMVLLNLAFVDI